MRVAPVVAAVLCVVVLASVSGSALGAEAAFRRVVVARGLSEPVQVTAPRSEPRRLYVVEQRGTIRVIENGKLRKGFFLDMRSRTAAGGEQGLLGLAFDPQYSSNRFIYVNYTDTSGDTRVVRYRTNGTRALPSTARVLLAIDQPYSNHNGGGLAFGPDGGLYVGTGDGGFGGDPENRAQDMATLLGKMLRLDVAVPALRPRSWHSASATPGATRSIGSPVTCTSRTSDRSSKRWITRLARARASRTTAGTSTRARAGSRTRVPALASSSSRSTSTPMTGAAPSSAGTSIAGPRGRPSAGATSSAITARAPSGACAPPAARRPGARRAVQDPEPHVLRGERRRRAVRDVTRGLPLPGQLARRLTRGGAWPSAA